MEENLFEKALAKKSPSAQGFAQSFPATAAPAPTSASLKTSSTPPTKTSSTSQNSPRPPEDPVFEKLLMELKQQLMVEGYSGKTLKMYMLYVREMLYHIKKPVESIDKRDIVSFLAFKKEKTCCSNATLALVHASMGYFFEKYLKMNVLDDIKIPKRAKSLPKVLTKDEIRAIFDATHFGRNRLMLQFMYGSGCRVSEVAKLKIEELNFKERTAMVRGGKGNKDRTIILSKDWVSDVKRYLDKKKIKSEFVFSKKNGTPISTDSIERIVRDSAVKAGITKHVTPHSFRHSYATHLLEAGTNIRYIQSLLGHSNLNTTQIYTNVANSQLKKVVSPLDKL